MPRPPGIGAFARLERTLDGPPRDLADLADRYVEEAKRVRRRPAPILTRYRYPRGRATDRIPLAAALQPQAGSGAVGCEERSGQ